MRGFVRPKSTSLSSYKMLSLDFVVERFRHLWAGICVQQENCRLPPNSGTLPILSTAHKPLAPSLVRVLLEDIPPYYLVDFSMSCLLGARVISIKKQNSLASWSYEGNIRDLKRGVLKWSNLDFKKHAHIFYIFFYYFTC